MDQVFALIGEQKNDEAASLIRDKLKLIEKQEVPIGQLVISKTVKDADEYKNPERMAHLAAAEKLRQKGVIVPSDTKIDYVVVDAEATPQETEPYHPSIRIDYEPDWNYYFERFVSTFTDIASVLGVSELELRSDQRQASLLDF